MNLHALFIWSHTNYVFHQNHVKISSFNTMLIHMAHLAMPRGFLKMCCQWAELGWKAPQDAQSTPQKPILLSLKATVLKFMYRQTVFCCSLEPLAVAFVALQEMGYRWGVYRPHWGRLLNPDPDLASSNPTAPTQPEGSSHPALGWTVWYKSIPLFSTWKRKSPVSTENTFLPTTAKLLCTINLLVLLGVFQYRKLFF